MGDDDNDFKDVWETYVVFAVALFRWLPKSEPGSYDPVAEARKRLDAVELLEGTAEAFQDPEERSQIQWALRRIREEMEDAAEGADEIVEIQGSLDIRLDPDALGGATALQGNKGRPPSLLTLHVKRLLIERHPAWDGIEPYPGQNTHELRDWLYERLVEPPWAPPWIREWAQELDDQLDPRSRGPLWKIVNNLQRIQ